MSENVVLIQQESGEDPFRGESDLTIIDVASEEIIDMGDVYHKKTIIKFSKTETTTASDLLTPEIKTYINFSNKNKIPFLFSRSTFPYKKIGINLLNKRAEISGSLIITEFSKETIQKSGKENLKSFETFNDY